MQHVQQLLCKHASDRLLCFTFLPCCAGWLLVYSSQPVCRLTVESVIQMAKQAKPVEHALPHTVTAIVQFVVKDMQ